MKTELAEIIGSARCPLSGPARTHAHGVTSEKRDYRRQSPGFAPKGEQFNVRFRG
jgi:hypothetical protein